MESCTADVLTRNHDFSSGNLRTTFEHSFAVRVAEISNFSKAFSSVQFSSFLFSQNTVQYKNTYRNNIVRLQGSPEETRRFYEAWAPQSKRDKQNKMIFAE